MNASSEGSDLPVHLMKGICCGHNWPTASIIHFPLGGNSMGCRDWSKLTIPLEWASSLSLKFSLMLIDIFVLYSKLLLWLLPEWILLLLAMWPFLYAMVAKQTTPWPRLIPNFAYCCNGSLTGGKDNKIKFAPVWVSGTLPVNPWTSSFCMSCSPALCCTASRWSPRLVLILPQENNMTPGSLTWVYGRALRRNTPIPSLFWKTNGGSEQETAWLSSLRKLKTELLQPLSQPSSYQW